MLKYVFKRILLMIPVLLGISFLIYSILEFSPGDPARLLLGQYASFEEVANLRAELGLDEPFLQRYVEYIVNAVQGNLGTSWRNSISVSKEIALRVQPTIKIALLGIGLSVVLGIILGVISAVKQYSVLDISGQILAVILSSMPAFFVGLLLMLVFALNLKWVPATFPASGDTFKNYILPSLSVAAASIAGIMRMTRSSMLEVIRQDYVRTARAKGATNWQITMKHSLRNALLPVVTQVGMLFATILGGTVVVEQVFAVSGLGIYIVNSVRFKDVPAVMGSVLIIAIVAGAINLIVDIIYAFIDPRIKSLYASSSR